MNIQETQNYLKERLSENRYYHTMCVANEAKKLALCYGADENKAYLAGLLHDILKETSKPIQLQIIEESAMLLDEVAISSPHIWHGWAAAVYIQKKLGIQDTEIIDAVRYHTTARKDMTLLDKIVYIADYISEDRTFDEVEKFRQLAYIDLEKTVYEALKYTIADLTKKDRPIYMDTFYAYNQYVLLLKGDN